MGMEAAKDGSRKNRTVKTVNTISAAREHYFDCVGAEAVQRAGCGDQLKGNVHEILFRDSQNLNPGNILKGHKTVLTKNPSATQVDAVTLNRQGKCVKRWQLKDCTSDSGVQKTMQQSRSGKYRQTTLAGTKETKAKYDSAKTASDKNMQSTGISSDRTGRIADNAGAKSRGNIVAANLRDIGKCSLASAGIGAAAGGAVSALSHYKDLRDGKIDGAEYVERVVVDTASGAVKTGATTATALLMKEGGKAVAKKCGSETVKRIAGSNVGTAVAFGVVEVGVDAVKWANGDMDGGEFAHKTTATVGGAAGGYGGAVGGAALGTLICPGIGTAIGGFIGALGGGLAGNSIGDFIGSIFD